MTVIERIEQLCKENGTALYKLEEVLGYARSSLRETEKNKPLNIGANRIVEIADYFGVSTDWLLKGYDPHYERFTDAERDIVYLFRMLDDNGKMQLGNYARFLAEETKKEERNIARRVEEA